jgi:hypothetical protein
MVGGKVEGAKIVSTKAKKKKVKLPRWLKRFCLFFVCFLS